MADTSGTAMLSYSPIEVRSYLPSGWNLEESEGAFVAEENSWQVDIQDVGELVSTLTVKKIDADRLGRIPALRAAIDRLYRSA